MRKYRRKKKKRKNYFLRIVLIIFAFLYALYLNDFDYTFGLDAETIQTFLDTYNNNSKNESVDEKKPVVVKNSKKELKVTFLDVGQADAILIQNGKDNMIIDAGNNNDGPLLVNYFKAINISKFKYVVGTHPHEDHIGGIDDIINNFEIDKFYIPDVITTTVTFTDVLDALENKKMKFDVPKIDDVWEFGDAKVEVIYTGTNEKDLNSTSIVLKLIYGDVKFLFTGDTTSFVERELVKKDIKSTVLKVAHHGSPYSTTNTFLNACAPKYAIISVGRGNNYGHPGDSIIQKLNRANVEIHRTDEEGSIVAVTDGNSVKFHTEVLNVNGG